VVRVRQADKARLLPLTVAKFAIGLIEITCPRRGEVGRGSGVGDFSCVENRNLGQKHIALSGPAGPTLRKGE
jgi:hypothetical protein